MNGTPAKIEILAPFGAAFEWMKAMLFRPFDLGRWLTIAFAAFISGSWGSGANFRWNQWSRGNWNYRMHRYGDFSDGTIPAWLIALIVVGVLLAMVLVFLWMWVSARGRFIFTDCVVRNRAAISEPWREYRHEGNSYFLFSLVVGFGIFVLMALLILVIVVPLGLFSQNQDATNFGLALIPLLCFGSIFVILVVLFSVVSHFMVPVMYRRRCSAREAFADVTKLILHNPGPFILFVLFGIALAIGVAVIGTAVMCATCCVGGLPYISTVLLLPAIVWLAAYRLLFLRQFGDQYDVWATVALSAPAAQSSAPPPVDPAG